MFVAVKRATLLYITGNKVSTTKHFYILLTDPFGPAKQVAMACVCSVRDGCDTTCLLKVGDHPFIEHPSYVAYNLSRIERSDALINGVAKGLFVDKGMLDEGVFQRVLAGVTKSNFTRPFIVDFLAECNKPRI